MPTFLTEPKWYDKNGNLMAPVSIYTEINEDNFLEIYNKVIGGERVCYYKKDTSGNGIEYIRTAVSAADYDGSKMIIFCGSITSNRPNENGEPDFLTYYYDNNMVTSRYFNFINLYMEYVCPLGCLSFNKVGEDNGYEWETLTLNIGGTNYPVYKRTK